MPAVALVDVRMPRLDGIAATREIVRASAGTRVLVLTTFDLDEHVFDALRAGASGLLLKDAPAEDVIAAIRVVSRGDALLAPAVTQRVIDAFAHLQSPTPERVKALTSLTAREVEVLRLVADEPSNAEIARALVISEATAKTHVSHLLLKLELRDRVQAVIFAYESGLVVPGNRDAGTSPSPA